MTGLGTVGVIGRFKPLHTGGALMLETLCQQAQEVKIGIGSSNKHNVRNPFTPEETKDMIESILHPRYTNYNYLFIPDFGQVEDFHDGQEWRRYMLQAYGQLSHFVSGNQYVHDLLQGDYPIIHPASLIPLAKHLRVRGSEVRLKIVQYDDTWKTLVPDPVAEYLEKNGLVERFKNEFGLETLAHGIDSVNYKRQETTEEEHFHAREK